MLLGLLANRSMHGYEIAEDLSQPRMQAWIRLGRTSIYYALGRMEKLGLVTKHSERHGGKPERTVYSITDEGRRAFVAGLEAALASGERPQDDFDIALYFSDTLDAPKTEEHVSRRLTELTGQITHLLGLVGDKGIADDSELVLVLEHRLAVLRADVEFLTGYVALLASGSGTRQSVSGSLGESQLSELLLSLQASGRTGMFHVRTAQGDTAFCFNDGRLYGVLPPQGVDVEEALRAAMSARRGDYEFDATEIISADAVQVGGLTQAMLIGGRGSHDAEAYAKMLPSPGAILGVREGYERDLIGVDLTDDERLALKELDGVRNVGELASALGWSPERLKRAVYAMWLVGWVVRVDDSKRALVCAVGAYLRRWEEAIELFAGPEGVRRVFDDVEMATSSAGLTSVRGIGGNLASRRFAVSEDDLAAHSREYVDLLHRSVAARLGDGFAEDVGRGFAQRLNPEDREVLSVHQIMA